MSIEVIKTQIEKFLDSPTPEVVAIKGKWGVGKTYCWNKFLKEAKNSERIKLEKYAYVSMFGINSLDAFKYAIFENVIDCNLIGIDANAETFQDNIGSLSKKIGKKLLPYAEAISRIGTRTSLTTTIESVAFLFLNNIIICIDDLERKGTNLNIKDVLGLVSLLKEQKNCKVVFLLNDGEAGLEDYEKHREKVIDIELEFSPDATESVKIALDGTELNDNAAEILKESSIKLNIKNIRLLKKIERLVMQILPSLDGYEQELTHQAVTSLVLFSWCYYCHISDGAPALDFVSTFERSFLGLEIEEDGNEEHKKWSRFIREYGYLNSDEFDVLLAKYIKAGYFIKDEIKETVEKKNKELLATKSTGSFREAWNLYHQSFDDNQEEVVSTLYESFKLNVKFISPGNLNGTVTLFREVGEIDKADEIIDLYIEARKTEIDLFNPEEFSIFSEKKDELLIEKFTNHYNSSLVIENAYQVLERISGKDGWNKKDEKILANTSVDEYYNIFKSSKDRRSRSTFITTCLKFGQFGSANKDMVEISKRATEALKRIANESLVNKSRVKLYGIQIDD